MLASGERQPPFEINTRPSEFFRRDDPLKLMSTQKAYRRVAIKNGPQIGKRFRFFARFPFASEEYRAKLVMNAEENQWCKLCGGYCVTHHVSSSRL